MTILAKWVLALACALLPVWLMIEHSSLAVETTPESHLAPINKSIQLSKAEAEQQLAHGLVLWRDKKYQQSAQVFASLAAKKLEPQLQSLTNLYHYHASAFIHNDHSEVFQPLSAVPKNCKQKLLFVTADLESLPQAEYFRSRFSQDPRMRDLSICIYEQTWFDPIDLVCKENWQQSGRLGCQLLSLAEKVKTVPFTHLVIFAKEGKANVHNGIMFLDRQDTYDVFIHELAHFSGFIDEYPLSKMLAKRVCAGVDSPNIVFKKAKQSEADTEYWNSMGHSSPAELYAARTCDNHSTQAYKASKKLTFMEYHDTAFIPANYLKAWQNQLQNTPNQPSAHVNFAQLYEQSKNLPESTFWRAKYQQYLQANTYKSGNL